MGKIKCFYVAYQTQTGMTRRIIDTDLDLDTVEGLDSWIKKEEKSKGETIIPVFWKRLKTPCF